MWDEYLLPASIDEALELLDRYKGQARILAGGTDLVIQARKKRLDLKTVVDITNITSLNYIKDDNGAIRLGPLVTHQSALESSILQYWSPGLVQACHAVGSPQIRQVGTIAGNIVNARPAADAAVMLVALGALAKIRNKQDERTQKVEDLFLGVGRSAVDPTREVVTEISFPAKKRGTSFVRLSPRRALSLPILNAAVAIELDQGNPPVVIKVRIVVSPVAPVPLRVTAAEEFLLGKPLDKETVTRAAELAAEQAKPRDSLQRGSSRFRKGMVNVLVKRALHQSFTTWRDFGCLCE